MSKVTVAIPVYNGERYIEKTILSLINQSYDDYEIFIVDNCSTDKTVEIVKKYPQVKLIINNENIGAEANFNKCLTVGAGDYIALFHADDIYQKEIIEESVKALKNNKVGVVGSLGHVIDENGDRTSLTYRLPFKTDKKIVNMDFPNIFPYLCLKGNTFLICPTMFFRRSVIKELEGFEFEKFKSASDLALWLKISMSYDLAIINKDLISYRVHQAQGSQKLIRENQRMPDSVKVFKFYSRFCEQVPSSLNTYFTFQVLIWTMRRIRAHNFNHTQKLTKIAFSHLSQSPRNLSFLKNFSILFFVSIDVLLKSSFFTKMLYRVSRLFT